MGFLGISGDRWKKIGKIALKVAPIVAAPFTGGASLLALGAGTGALSGYLGGGGIKGALLGAGLGAIPGGGAGGAAAGGIAKAGLKQLATGVAKGAATNFATGTATGLATGQGLKGALKSGGGSALTNLGSTGGAGGLKDALKTGAKQVALNAGTSAAGRLLTGGGGQQQQGGQNIYQNYLPQQGSPGAAGGGGGMDWKQALLQGGLGALSGSQQGGGWKGALQGGAQGALNTGAQGSAPGHWGGGQPGGGYPNFSGGGGYPGTPGYAGGYPGFSLTGGGGGSFNTNPGQGGAQTPYGSPGPTYPQTQGGAQPVFRSTTIAPQTAQPGEPNIIGAGTPGQTSAGGGGNPQTAPGGTPQSGFWEKYGPLIAQGGGLVVGGLAGRQATKMAQQRSPEELAALGGAQGAAGQLTRSGGQAVRGGLNALGRPQSYFETLLSGNRAAMSQAVAGPTAQLTGTYRGAERNLQQQGIRGAARDVAAADLNRERASKIAGLTTGIQPYAAEQLAGMGQNMLQTGSGMLGQGGSLYGNLLTQGTENRKYAREEGGKTAGAIGGLARDLGEVAFKKSPTQPTYQPRQLPRKPIPTGGGVALPPGVQMSQPPPGPIPVGGPGVPMGPGYGMSPPPQGGTARAPLPFQMGNW